MELSSKLTKQITETKYLSVENTDRYRPIMRIFFENYEKLNYWLFKEDIFNELKNMQGFENYTLDLCESDLTQLYSWGNLTYFQDTENVMTVKEFQNRRFRYQMTDYAVEIERFVSYLEIISVKTSSLEPKIFEKLRNLITKISTLSSSHDIHDCFEELNYQFTNMNENYKSFLKTFHEAKTEDLMKKESFIIYKEKVIKYLREFISGFQLNNLKIVDLIEKLPENFEETLMDNLIEYQKNIPNMEPDFDYNYLREINQGKWRSIIHWFKNDGSISESSRLKKAINDIIDKIMKNVSAIMEMQASSINRKEEYKHLLGLLCKSDTLEEIELLCPHIFGLINTKHLSKIEKSTESIDYDVKQLENVSIELKSHSRKIKERVEKKPIIDKSLAKQAQLNEIMSIKKKEKEILNGYIDNGKIEIKSLGKVNRFERRFILSLITAGIKSNDYVMDGEHGILYKVTKQSNDYVKLDSEDGMLEMPDFLIEFGGKDGK